HVAEVLRRAPLSVRASREVLTDQCEDFGPGRTRPGRLWVAVRLDGGPEEFRVPVEGGEVGIRLSPQYPVHEVVVVLGQLDQAAGGIDGEELRESHLLPGLAGGVEVDVRVRERDFVVA